MSGEYCARCAALELEVSRLRAENQRLRERLALVRYYCQRMLDKVDPILSRRSGVPRGRWSFARGLYETAAIVKRVIES
jgi:hypothetical protein